MRTADGSAGHIPVKDASVGVVICAKSFRWLDYPYRTEVKVATKVQPRCSHGVATVPSAPDWNRTSDLRIRSSLLYPTELRGRDKRTFRHRRDREIIPCGVGKIGFCPRRLPIGLGVPGGCSSVRLEHLVVVQDVGGSNPLSHPSGRSLGVFLVPIRCTGPPGSVASGAAYAPLAQLAERRTLNPQVPGSSPGGRTAKTPDFSTNLRGQGLFRFQPKRPVVTRWSREFRGFIVNDGANSCEVRTTFM